MFHFIGSFSRKIKHPPRNHCEMGVLYKYEKPNSRYKGTAFAHICKYIMKKKHPPRNLCEMGQ